MKQCTNSSDDGISCGEWKPSTDFPAGRNQCYSCVYARKHICYDKNAEERARNGPITEKQCSKCKKVRTISFFATQNNNKDGYNETCMVCYHFSIMIDGAEKRTAERIKKGRVMEPVSITEDDLKVMDPVCAYSRVPLVLCSGHVHTASLERLLNHRGYTKKNSVMVDIRMNVQARMSREKFLASCGPEWRTLDKSREHILSLPPSHMMDGRTLGFRLRQMTNSANKRNKEKVEQEKKKPVEDRMPLPDGGLSRITADFLHTLWTKQGGRCAYSNLPMGWGKMEKSDWNVSIERLNKGWYVEENIALICGEFNSTEYCTNRFGVEDGDEPQGWSKEVVRKYRDGEYPQA
jgi:hypothetical protein